MKRYLFYMLFLLLCNFQTTASNQNNQKKSALYNSYFILKEYSNFCINYRYYTDQEKVEKAKIVCNQCDYIVGFRHLCCHYIFKIEKTKLENVIDQMKNASTNELSSLLLNAYEEPCIPCDQCKECHGWHIESSNQNIQSKKENTQFEHAKQKLYTHLFLLKELCAIPFYACFYTFFLDKDKIKKSEICCLQCNYKMNALHLWGWLIGESDQSSLQGLKNIIYDGSQEELASFILKNVEERKIECNNCRQFNGYYIPEDQLSQQS